MLAINVNWGHQITQKWQKCRVSIIDHIFSGGLLLQLNFSDCSLPNIQYQGRMQALACILPEFIFYQCNVTHTHTYMDKCIVSHMISCTDITCLCHRFVTMAPMHKSLLGTRCQIFPV